MFLTLPTPAGPGLLALAVFLDLIVGDPRSLPHPVRVLGWLADRLEALARSGPLSVLPLRLAGLLCVLVMAWVSYAAVDMLQSLPGIGSALGLYFAFAGLALGSLLRECRDAARAISRGERGGNGAAESSMAKDFLRELEEARACVGMLVSRDTGQLDRVQLRRTLAETLSENLCDGFVAPLLFLALGGPPLLWAYKAVSTMDSMWGYRTEKWRALGWASARLDDVLAFVPARVTALSMLLAGTLLRLVRAADVFKLLKAIRHDAGTTASPNAGWPMAAAAWLLGAPVGGEAVYFGEAREKPVLGPCAAALPHGQMVGQWDADRLRRLLELCVVSGLLCAAAAFVVLASVSG